MGFSARPSEVLNYDLVALAFEASDDWIQLLSANETLLLLNVGGAAAMRFDALTVPVGQNWDEFRQGKEREAAREALATGALHQTKLPASLVATGQEDGRAMSQNASQARGVEPPNDASFSGIHISSLHAMTPEQVDALPFGVVGLAADGTTEVYSATESRLAGIPRSIVLGWQYFAETAQCSCAF